MINLCFVMGMRRCSLLSLWALGWTGRYQEVKYISHIVDALDKANLEYGSFLLRSDDKSNGCCKQIIMSLALSCPPTFAL